MNVKNRICLCYCVDKSLIKCTLTSGSHVWPTDGSLELCRANRLHLRLRAKAESVAVLIHSSYDHWQDIIHCLPISSREYKSRISSLQPAPYQNWSEWTVWFTAKSPYKKYCLMTILDNILHHYSDSADSGTLMLTVQYLSIVIWTSCGSTNQDTIRELIVLFPAERMALKVLYCQ